MATTDKPHCKDCKLERPDDPPYQWRDAKYPGPRCYTHWRHELKRRKAVKHKAMVIREYNLTEGQYEELYEWQGGRCAICHYATGKTRRLCVDHDHKTGEVRGLLCRPCNTLVGRAGDNPEFFERGRMYLQYPPFGRMKRVQWLRQQPK